MNYLYKIECVVVKVAQWESGRVLVAVVVVITE